MPSLSAIREIRKSQAGNMNLIMAQVELDTIMSRLNAMETLSFEEEERAVLPLDREGNDSECEFGCRRGVASEERASTPDFAWPIPASAPDCAWPEPVNCCERRGLHDPVLGSYRRQLPAVAISEEESMEYSIKRFQTFDRLEEELESHIFEPSLQQESNAGVPTFSTTQEPQMWVPVMVPVELVASNSFWGSACCLVSATPLHRPVVAQVALAAPLCFVGSPNAPAAPLAPCVPAASIADSDLGGTLDVQPPPARPVQESLTHSFCTTSGVFSVSWRLDARKLKGNNQCLVSPEFKLCFRSMSDPAAFKLIVRPKQTNSSSGRCSFAKSKGIGVISLKNESDICGPEACVKFCISVGRNSSVLTKRGPVSHQFASHPVGQLPKDQEEWNFKYLTDPSSLTILICLEIMPNSSPALEEEASTQDAVSPESATPRSDFSDANGPASMSDTSQQYQLHVKSDVPATQMSSPSESSSKMKGRCRSEHGRQHQLERWRQRLSNGRGRCRSEKGHQHQLERWYKRLEVYHSKKAPAVEEVAVDRDVVGEVKAQRMFYSLTLSETSTLEGVEMEKTILGKETAQQTSAEAHAFPPNYFCANP